MTAKPSDEGGAGVYMDPIPPEPVIGPSRAFPGASYCRRCNTHFESSNAKPHAARHAHEDAIHAAEQAVLAGAALIPARTLHATTQLNDYTHVAQAELALRELKKGKQPCYNGGEHTQDPSERPTDPPAAPAEEAS